MIVTQPKDFDRVVASLDTVRARTVFLVGCGSCATTAKTGGEPELQHATTELSSRGYVVSGHVVPESGCSVTGTKAVLRKYADQVAAADAILVFACGTGVQTVSEVVDAPVMPALDTFFLGNVMRIGRFVERCQMCGECVLDRTGGICPVTQCPKGLMNGPCGGMANGMCEVIPDQECAHVRIRRKLSSQHRLTSGFVPPKNYGFKVKPGKIDVRTPRSNGEGAR